MMKMKALWSLRKSYLLKNRLLLRNETTPTVRLSTFFCPVSDTHLCLAIPGTTVYPAHLMPGFNTSSFDAPKDIVLSQLPVYDIDGKVVKPWNLANVLVEGALIVARVTMRAWVVKERSVCSYFLC